MKRILILLYLVCTLTIMSCNGGKHDASTAQAVNAAIHETTIEIAGGITIAGYLMGVNLDKNEVYVLMLYPEKHKYIVKIIDPQSGAETKSIGFLMGDIQSPTDFEGPSYIAYLDGKYYVIDQNQKIVAYNAGFNYLYAGMLPRTVRVFVDFYTYNNNVYFLMGQSTYLEKEIRYNINSFRLPANKKPEPIHEFYESHHEAHYTRNGNKYYYIIFFRSSNWGFEKDGNIFYADNRENKYYRYNLSSRKTDAFELSYLKPKIYSPEEAEKAAHYKGMNWDLKNLKTVIVPGEDATYHQGLYDVGKDKIGIIADIDINGFTFRLDIFDSRAAHYLYSIRLPFGQGFLNRTSSQNRGYSESYIDIDRGIYVWTDMDEENHDGLVQVTRFKLKTGS